MIKTELGQTFLNRIQMNCRIEALTIARILLIPSVLPWVSK